MGERTVKMERAIVMGAGSWGTALAAMLAQRGLRVQFWGRDEALMQEIASTRSNERYLPGLIIEGELEATHELNRL